MKRIVFTLGLVLTFIWVCWSIYKAVIPIQSIRDLELEAIHHAYMDSLPFTDHADHASHQKTLIYKSALKAVNKNDSINLVINLADSLLGLYINGVMIFKVSAFTYFIDDPLLGISNRALSYHFGKPIKIESDTASMVKEPVIIKEAPKSPAEAALQASKPDSGFVEPVFWVIEANENVSIFLHQQTLSEPTDRRIYQDFEKIARNNKKKLLIRIALPNEELKAIYRAMPAGGKLILIL